MKIIVEEGDLITTVDGGLKPGVYVVDGKNPEDCGIESNYCIKNPGQWDEEKVRIGADKFVLRADLLHIGVR